MGFLTKSIRMYRENANRDREWERVPKAAGMPLEAIISNPKLNDHFKVSITSGRVDAARRRNSAFLLFFLFFCFLLYGGGDAMTTFVLTALSNVLLFFGTLTPSWQVAEDTDVGRGIESGLWIYCPGHQNCWYIFSDDLINYYEKVDVCRFLLIGDCRKKLLRTPYFFGWHYAVLVMMIIAMSLTTLALVSLAVSYFYPHRRRLATIVMDAALGSAFLTLCIGLSVFVINAEMLESRFLIGVKNTFVKSYGYSFYLACLGLCVMLFAMLAAVLCTSTLFFGGDSEDIPMDIGEQFVMDSRGNIMMHPSYNPMKQQSPYVSAVDRSYAPSEASTLQTRTFLSY